jgi:hypothetical protein
MACGVAVAALLATGCGGDGEPASTGEAATETTAVESVPQTAPDTTAAAEAEAARKAERAKARRRLAAQRKADAKRAVKAVALALDVEVLSVATDRPATTVTITLAHQHACRTDDAKAATFKRSVKTAAPHLKKVQLRGEESKKDTLARYRKRNCRLRTAPKAPVVLDSSGTGDEFLQGPFRMTASPWTIEYGSDAKRFRLEVIDQNDRTVVSVGKPGSGLGQQLVNTTGSFAIRITSSGKWTVRLRNGS